MDMGHALAPLDCSAAPNETAAQVAGLVSEEANLTLPDGFEFPKEDTDPTELTTPGTPSDDPAPSAPAPVSPAADNTWVGIAAIVVIVACAVVLVVVLKKK